MFYCIAGNLTIGIDLIISNSCQSFCHCIESIGLVRQHRLRSEVLEVTIRHIGEVYISISGVDGNIVDRVKLATVIIVDKLGGIVRGNGVG